MVKISVVVPTFNEEKRIKKCLESIRDQTYKNFELIVSDGDSTDNTRDIAKRFADRIVIEKKRSPSAERQRGAKNAKGDIIAFIDADSIAEKDWLKKIVSSFRKTRTIGVYGCAFLSDGNAVENFIIKKIYYNFLKISGILNLPAAAGINMAVKKDYFEKSGGFDTDLSTNEDINLFDRLKKYGRVKFSDAIVYTSKRRIAKWGYFKFLLYHLTNFIMYNLAKKSHAHYETVR